MGEAVEQCGGHFGIAKDLDPFPEGQIGGDQRGLFVEFADQMEEQGAAGLREGQVAQLIRTTRSMFNKIFTMRPLWPWIFSCSSWLTRSTTLNQRTR